VRAAARPLPYPRPDEHAAVFIHRELFGVNEVVQRLVIEL
jgi:hypothetical protein